MEEKSELIISQDVQDEREQLRWGIVYATALLEGIRREGRAETDLTWIPETLSQEASWIDRLLSEYKTNVFLSGYLESLARKLPWKYLQNLRHAANRSRSAKVSSIIEMIEGEREEAASRKESIDPPSLTSELGSLEQDEAVDEVGGSPRSVRLPYRRYYPAFSLEHFWTASYENEAFQVMSRQIFRIDFPTLGMNHFYLLLSPQMRMVSPDWKANVQRASWAYLNWQTQAIQENPGEYATWNKQDDQMAKEIEDFTYWLGLGRGFETKEDRSQFSHICDSVFRYKYLPKARRVDLVFDHKVRWVPNQDHVLIPVNDTRAHWVLIYIIERGGVSLGNRKPTVDVVRWWLAAISTLLEEFLLGQGYSRWEPLAAFERLYLGARLGFPDDALEALHLAIVDKLRLLSEYCTIDMINTLREVIEGEGLNELVKLIESVGASMTEREESLPSEARAGEIVPRNSDEGPMEGDLASLWAEVRGLRAQVTDLQMMLRQLTRSTVLGPLQEFHAPQSPSMTGSPQMLGPRQSPDALHASGYVTVADASRLRGLSTSRIKQLIQEGRLVASKQGDTWWVNSASLMEYDPPGRGRPAKNSARQLQSPTSSRR